MGRHTAIPPRLRAGLGPLVALLRQELQAARLPEPGPPPDSIAAFARWYLEALQQLERHAAGADEHAPMTRGEVELMCRCLLSATDLREAIGMLCRYAAMLAPRAGSLSLLERGDTAVLRLDSLRRVRSSGSSLVDIAGLFSFLQLLRWLTATEFRVRLVRIGPVRREDLLPFLTLFRAPVLAGGRYYALEFPRAWLARAVVRGKDEFAAFFEVFPCDVFDAAADDLPQQVGALLGAAAMRGERIPSLAQVAATLELPPSTLRRRLERLGTGFRALREQALEAQARLLLERGEAGIGAIAARLGFSEPGAFRRAFRRWTGSSPLAWRRAARRGR